MIGAILRNFRLTGQLQKKGGIITSSPLALRSDKFDGKLVALGVDGIRRKGHEEKVTADAIGCGHAHYTQASTGVEVEITCEGVEPNPPSDRAFVDPDAPEPEESE